MKNSKSSGDEVADLRLRPAPSITCKYNFRPESMWKIAELAETRRLLNRRT